MEHWMLMHELSICRHCELLREATRARMARVALERPQVGGSRLVMALSLAAVAVMALVQG